MAMTQMSSTVTEVARSAASAAAAARNADQEAASGQAVLHETLGSISALADSVMEAAETIRALHRETTNIGGILDVIRGIADQTNLLALNAAIEAARAGDQGRGFAVVAEEVRTLAQRSQGSTAEIQDLIARLQGSAEQAVAAMEQGRSRAESSVEQAQRACVDR